MNVAGDGGILLVRDGSRFQWTQDVDGVLRLRLIEGEINYHGPAPIEVTRGTDVERIDVPHPPHIQQPLIEAVVAHLRGEGESPSTGHTAMRTNEVIDTVLADYYRGRDDAFWDRPETWNSNE